MKFRILLLLAALAVFTGLSKAQTPVPGNLTYTWPAATTGTSNAQLGKYLILSGTSSQRPNNYTLDVSVNGTTPNTCTFRVEGSSDGAIWYGLDVTSPSTTSCTSSFMESIANRPVQYLHIILTYTQGDATTSVVFHFTGAR